MLQVSVLKTFFFFEQNITYIKSPTPNYGVEEKVVLQRAALASWSEGELKRLSINLNETAAKLKDRKSISWMIPKSSAGGGLEVIATRSDLQSVLKQMLL